VRHAITADDFVLPNGVRLSTTSTAVAALEVPIQSAVDAVTAINTTVLSLGDNLTVALTQISNVDGRLQTVEMAVSSLQSGVSTMEQTVNANSNEIFNIGGRLTTAESTLASTALTATSANDIANQTAGFVSTLQTTVSEIDTRVTAIESSGSNFYSGTSNGSFRWGSAPLNGCYDGWGTFMAMAPAGRNFVGLPSVIVVMTDPNSSTEWVLPRTEPLNKFTSANVQFPSLASLQPMVNGNIFFWTNDPSLVGQMVNFVAFWTGLLD